MSNRVLGRGLSSLLKEEVAPVEISTSENSLDIDLLDINTDQPRKIFDKEKIKELADSIVSHGLVQPIVVKKLISGRYQIIAGERRFRACRLAGLKNVPVIKKDFDRKQILEIALIENIQRQELTAIEEAEGYQKLVEEYGYSAADLAASVGKSRSHVANILRLNQLPDLVKQMVNEGKLSMGHARCLIAVEDAENLAAKIIANDLNVRQAEDLANQRKNNARKKNKDHSQGNNSNQEVDEDLVLLGYSLSEKYGVKVVVENSWNGGKVSFHYSNLEELDKILTKIGQN